MPNGILHTLNITSQPTFLFELQEHLVLIQLKGVIDNDFLYDCESANCRLLVSFLSCICWGFFLCHVLSSLVPCDQVQYLTCRNAKEPRLPTTLLIQLYDHLVFSLQLFHCLHRYWKGQVQLFSYLKSLTQLIITTINYYLASAQCS